MLPGKIELSTVGIQFVWNLGDYRAQEDFDWTDLVELGNILNQLCLIG